MYIIYIRRIVSDRRGEGGRGHGKYRMARGSAKEATNHLIDKAPIKRSSLAELSYVRLARLVGFALPWGV